MPVRDARAWRSRPRPSSRAGSTRPRGSSSSTTARAIETATERASLIADLPKLKAAVATGDPPTVEPVAREYRTSVRSDVFAVTDREGRTLASLGAAPAARPARGRATPAFQRRSDGRLLEIVTVPIVLGEQSPELLGHLTLGFALDDAFATRLSALTGSHVAVVTGGPGLRLDACRASWTRRSRRGRRRAAASTSRARTTSPRAPTLGDARARPQVLVLRSRAEALRPLRTLRAALAVAAVVAVAVSLLLSWAVARTVTRPLAALTDAMKEIAATGDLARSLGARRAPGTTRTRALVARTFGTLTDSIARFQREAALRERLSALGRLSTVVAHEVRNPLMIIKGSLRALRRDGAAPEEVREAAADIDTQVARLDRVVGDVLDFARPLRIEPSSVDAHRRSRATRPTPRSRVPPRSGARFAFEPGGDAARHRRRAAARRARQPGRRTRARASRRPASPASGGDLPAVEVGSRRARSRAGCWSGSRTRERDRASPTCRTCSSHTSRPSGPGPASGSRSRARSSRRWAARCGSTAGRARAPRVEIELPAAPARASAAEIR